MEYTAKSLQHILTGLAFPARRWELIAAADAYGADARTRMQLEAIPAATYRSFADVVRAIQQVRNVRTGIT